MTFHGTNIVLNREKMSATSPKEETIEKKKNYIVVPPYVSYGKQATIILLVLVLGFFAVNQYLEYRLNVTKLSQPCLACINIVKEEMPSRVPCLESCLLVKRSLFLQPNGDLKDNFGYCWDSSGSKKVDCLNPFTFNMSNIT